MRLAFPTPIKGWRTLAGEVGVIVLGVLLALGAEQAIDNWNWRQKSSSAEVEISDELLWAAAYSDERLRLSKCFEGKLDQLQQKLLVTNAPVAQPLYRSRYWTIVRLWSTDAWETARAGDVLTRMKADKVRNYATIYRQIEVLRANLALEQQYIADLAMLTWFTGRISDQMRDRLLAASARARRANEMIKRDAAQILTATSVLGIKLTDETRAPSIQCGSMDQPETL